MVWDGIYLHFFIIAGPASGSRDRQTGYRDVTSRSGAGTREQQDAAGIRVEQKMDALLPINQQNA